MNKIFQKFIIIIRILTQNILSSILSFINQLTRPLLFLMYAMKYTKQCN